MRSTLWLITLTACTHNKPVPTTTLDSIGVVNAVFAAISDSDSDALERLVREDYVQHSSQVTDGRQGLIDALPLLSGVQVKQHRVLIDGDKVMLHQTYTLPDQSNWVAFDVFRLQGGQLAEHWDALQLEVAASDTVSGRSMTDGPNTVTDPEHTATNRSLVTGFVNTVLTQGAFDQITTYLSTDQYDQHNPQIGDGIDGIGTLASGLDAAGLSFGYTRSPLVVAEGNFVFVGSEGFFGPADAPPYALFYDLWRVEQGKIVEHWDVVPEAPNASTLPHRNGFF